MTAEQLVRVATDLIFVGIFFGVALRAARDLRLPDARGERVLEALKADPATAAIPVVVVTVEDDLGHTRPLGADDHLTKPIDRERLAAWLRSVAGREEVPRAAPAG